jgi:hypothetical protein
VTDSARFTFSSTQGSTVGFGPLGPSVNNFQLDEQRDTHGNCKKGDSSNQDTGAKGVRTDHKNRRGP